MNVTFTVALYTHMARRPTGASPRQCPLMPLHQLQQQQLADRTKQWQPRPFSPILPRLNGPFITKVLMFDSQRWKEVLAKALRHLASKVRCSKLFQHLNTSSCSRIIWPRFDASSNFCNCHNEHHNCHSHHDCQWPSHYHQHHLHRVPRHHGAHSETWGQRGTPTGPAIRPGGGCSCRCQRELRVRDGEQRRSGVGQKVLALG